MFSFRLGKAGQPSQLIIGKPDNMSHLTYFPVKKDSYYWSVPVSSLKTGGVELRGGQGVNRALIDTGTSLIVMPRGMYSHYLRSLGDSCYEVFGQVACECEHDYPDLVINLIDRDG